VTTVKIVGIALIIVGFSCPTPALGWVAVGLLVTGLFVVHQVTLKRFRCPECGERLRLKWPSPGEFVKFRCQRCNILWLTGIRTADNTTD
jgi:hypothetical protein